MLPAYSSLYLELNYMYLTFNTLFQSELYHGLFNKYPADYTPDNVRLDDSGKLAVLMGLLCELSQTSPLQKVVVVSNYTQVSVSYTVESRYSVSRYTAIWKRRINDFEF